MTFCFFVHYQVKSDLTPHSSPSSLYPSVSTLQSPALTPPLSTLHSQPLLFTLDFLYLLVTEKNSETNATCPQQGIKRGADKTNKQNKKVRWNDEEEESDSSAESEEEIIPNKTKQQNVDRKKGSSKENEFEVVPVEDNSKFSRSSRPCWFFFFTARLMIIVTETCQTRGNCCFS